MENIEPPIESAEIPEVEQPKDLVRRWEKMTPVKKTLAIAVAVLVFFLVFIEVSHQINIRKVDGLADSERGIPLDTSKLKVAEGKLYLTLIPNDGRRDIDIYTYDVISNKLERMEKELPDGVNVTGSVSPDGLQFAFMGLDGKGFMQLFVKKHAEGNKESVRQVTDDDLKFKREPSWAPGSHRVAYSVAPSDKEKDSGLPDSWSVYISDLNNRETFITNGYNPLFSPDGNSLIILKNDGLYLYSLVNRELSKVWGIGGQANTFMKLSLSNDARTLSWSDHLAHNNNGALLIFDIKSWNPFGIELKRQLERYTFHSQFSPDGKYLATLIGNQDPYVELINLDNFATQKILDLTGFSTEYLWLSDWSLK